MEISTLFKRAFKLWFMVPAVFWAIFNFSAFYPENIYGKDFVQDYLGAKAIVSGVNPYQSLPALAERFLPQALPLRFTHPTPHPPAALLLGLPLTLLPYSYAAGIWLILQWIAIYAIYRIGMASNWVPKQLSRHPLLLLGVVMAWAPTAQDMLSGNLMLFLLLLLAALWYCQTYDKQILAGVSLGVAISIKLMVWPLILFFVLRKKWRALLAVLLSVGVINIIAMLVIGIESFLFYYLNVGAVVSPLYQRSVYNFSIWTLGTKVLCDVQNLSLCPFAFSKWALPVNTVIALTSFLVALILAWRAKEALLAYGILICISLLLSPVTWRHYFVLAIIPLMYLHMLANQQNWSRQRRYIWLVLVLIMGLPDLVGLLALPLVAPLVALAPTLSVLALMGLLAYTDRAIMAT